MIFGFVAFTEIFIVSLDTGDKTGLGFALG